MCIDCPAGYFCSKSDREECGKDYYCPNGQFERELCPAGTYTVKKTASSNLDCVSCPPGFYCIAPASTGGRIQIKKCPAGKFCLRGASSDSGTDKCPIGLICPEGSIVGIPCPPGFYCSAQGMSSTTSKCKAGYYCTGGTTNDSPTDGRSGDRCPPGHYCLEGSKWPTPCAIGTYSEATGNTLSS
jgi:hypothetical protein